MSWRGGVVLHAGDDVMLRAGDDVMTLYSAVCTCSQVAEFTLASVVFFSQNEKHNIIFSIFIFFILDFSIIKKIIWMRKNNFPINNFKK